jgi:hypothetical protein
MEKTSSRMISTKTLRVLSWVALLLLSIEFVLGMLANLYIEIPSPLPGTTGGMLQALVWSLSQTGMPSLWLHVVLGLALLLIGIALLVLSIAARQRRWIITSLLAALGILFATLSGTGFVNTGEDAASMAMSIGFVVALLSYGTGLYFSS